MVNDFAKCLDFSSDYMTIPDTLDCKQYCEIARRFSENCSRVHSLGFVPLQINYWTAHYTAGIVMAQIKTKTVDMRSNDETYIAEAKKLFAKAEKAWSLRTPEEREAEIVSVGSANVETLVKIGIPRNLSVGQEAILCAMITEAWSSFEALAIDLWIKAVNLNPDPLAKDFAKRNGQKQIEIDYLARYNFITKDYMGEILHDLKKIKTESLDDLRSLYSSTFGPAVAAVLQSDDLFMAERTRHLIAHRSGVVDAKYLNEARGKIPYDGFTEGLRIPINGPLVATMVGACVQAGVDLLKFVDDWSTNSGQHPPTI